MPISYKKQKKNGPLVTKKDAERYMASKYARGESARLQFTGAATQVGDYDSMLPMPIYRPKHVSLNRPELKFRTQNASYNLTGATINIDCLNLLTQGTSSSTRVGDKTRVTSVDYRYLIASDQATQTAAVSVRVLLIWDTQPNGAFYAATDILTTAVPESSFNQDKVPSRFKILADRYHLVQPVVMSAAGVISNVNTKQEGHFKCKIGDITQYNGNAGTIADIVKGSLTLAVLSSANLTSGWYFNGVTFYYD